MRLKIKAIIFDMDGVITDTMPYHFKVWQEIFQDEGITVSREDVYKREGQKGIESLREIFRDHNKVFVEAHARCLLKLKEEKFKKIFKRRYIDGACSFIRSRKADGFRLGLVTGTSRHEAMNLLPESLFKLFDVSVCGCEVSNGKPHPEPYLTALKKLLIKPGDAVVIENAPFGIKSAKAAGLSCLALETSLPKKYLKEADGVFESFNAIISNVSFHLNE